MVGRRRWRKREDKVSLVGFASGLVLSCAIATALPQGGVAQIAQNSRAKSTNHKPLVCEQGCEFSDLTAAIRASSPGGLVSIAPGTYRTCGIVDKPLRLIGLKDSSGNRARLVDIACEGKGAIVVKASGVIIEGLEISGISVPSKNGACIRLDPEAGEVMIRDLYCHDSEEGILGGAPHGNIVVEDSRFERNGANEGRAHGIYINGGDTFTLRRSQIISTKGWGHTLKSGARRTVIEDSVLAALNGQNSRAIDAYGGGILEVRQSVIEQGPNSDNDEAIGIALELNRLNPEPHSTLLEDNWIIFDDLAKRCRLLLKATPTEMVTVRGNRIVGMIAVSEPTLGALVEDNNRLYRDRGETELPPYNSTLSSLPKPDESHKVLQNAKLQSK
jgi:hypothetical protein